jgi:hypothetical protein
LFDDDDDEHPTTALQVESQFRKKWLHGGTTPQVRAIYKIVCATENITRFQQYLSVSVTHP